MTAIKDLDISVSPHVELICLSYVYTDIADCFRKKAPERHFTAADVQYITLHRTEPGREKLPDRGELEICHSAQREDCSLGLAFSDSNGDGLNRFAEWGCGHPIPHAGGDVSPDDVPAKDVPSNRRDR